MASPPGLIFVTVGTDHHPFNRLIEWIDSWLATNGNRGVRCLVQSGTGTTPRHATWRRFLPHEETLAACRDATAVVSHGGPGTIMSCRSLGLVPIVVPRLKRLGEHVDDHQVAFARKMAQQGEVRLAERREELWALLDQAVDEPAAFRAPARRVSADHAVTRFGELVDDLLRLGSVTRRRWPTPIEPTPRSEG
jgi:UDP-N-acetylglucosamine transferase subunit ALG13